MHDAKPRSDGWTPQRQLRFLDILARTRSVTKAARAAGMSRESAHRLRTREPHGLFAAAWDKAVGADRTALTRAEIDEGHIRLIRMACGPEGANFRLSSRQRQIRDPHAADPTSHAARFLPASSTEGSSCHAPIPPPNGPG